MIVQIPPNLLEKLRKYLEKQLILCQNLLKFSENPEWKRQISSEIEFLEEILACLDESEVRMG